MSAAPLVQAPVLGTLQALAERVRPVASSEERLLPLVPELAALVPHGGLRRGSTVGVSSASLVLRALAAATVAGSWAAVVGRSELGWAAAAESGVCLDHVAVIDVPPREMAGPVLAALVDAVDLVVVGAPVVRLLRGVEVRRVVARARERGAVLFVDEGWPDAVDLRWRVVDTHCEGLGEGWGHITSWQVEVLVDGRGAATRPRRGWVSFRGKTNANVGSVPVSELVVRAEPVADSCQVATLPGEGPKARAG